MVGELSDDSTFVNMSFEDVHRIVTTMKITELILNDTVKSNRKERIERIKVQIDAEHVPNMAALLDELEKRKGKARPDSKTLIPTSGSFRTGNVQPRWFHFL
jgi:hypothetical protein